MQEQSIEIDQEVFNFLKKQAEPFVDTPNDVLRRLLLSNSVTSQVNRDVPFKASSNTPPSVPAGIPKALEQILQVVYLVRFLGLTRSRATKRVAAIHNVTSQTVLDKYCRQLNLSASDFDKFLSEPGITTLKNKLNNKFYEYREVINSYLNKSPNK